MFQVSGSKRIEAIGSAVYFQKERLAMSVSFVIIVFGQSSDFFLVKKNSHLSKTGHTL